jgi:Xaa-Pro aminopeptidase
VADALGRAGYTALICRIPQHVLMLSGYLPVLGNSFCIATREGGDGLAIRLAVPADEVDLVPREAGVAVCPFREETLGYIGTTLEAACEPLRALLQAAGLSDGGIVGYEGNVVPIATAYTQVGVPSPATLDVLRALLPDARLRDASPLLADLQAVKTAREIAGIERATAVAREGFLAARGAVGVGATEADVAAATQAALVRAGYAAAPTGRILPHVHVMAGPRSANAYRAYNLTSGATIRRGDPVLVQMEVGVDGYWAELTRAFFAADAPEPWPRAHRACLAAQQEALAAIRDGARARAADAAARRVLDDAGFGDAFRHGLGHGVGFQAINHGAAPILHPASDAVLATGMVHNVEPAVYLAGQGGIRLNDNVAVCRDGARLLSAAVPRDLDWLVVAA